MKLKPKNPGPLSLQVSCLRRTFLRQVHGVSKQAETTLAYTQVRCVQVTLLFELKQNLSALIDEIIGLLLLVSIGTGYKLTAIARVFRGLGEDLNRSCGPKVALSSLK